MEKIDVRKISVVGVLTAVAYLFTFIFHFKVAFLTFDFKDSILAIVSFLYGPLYGLISAATVALFEFLSFSDTGVYGLIMNFLASGTFAVTCGVIYKIKHSFSGAIISVITSVITVTTVMLLANIFITPYYMGVSTGEVIKLLPKLLLPFNLCKSLINAMSVMVIYKPITRALKNIGLIKNKKEAEQTSKSRSVILIISSVLIIALTVLFLIFILDGNFEFFRS